jgi:phosphoribosylaminoimidazole-succinocarboxamide synthase
VRESIRSAPELAGEYREGLLAGALEECCEKGARTHHGGMLDAVTGEVVRSGVPAHASNCNVVRKYQILKPERVEFLGAHLFDYSKVYRNDGFVVPLEYIVRFGITSASSVYRKYLVMDEKARRVFERELGVSKPLEAWQYLEKPVNDWTSKYEPEDRMVSKQEAFVMSGLRGDQFVKSGKLAVLGAWVVRKLVEEIGLLLWDIKWEFAKDGEDLVFVDTIDTDSIRATLFLESDGRRYVNHYNKQAVRDYFLIFHGDWIAAIKEAKAQGAAEGVDFTGLLKAGQQSGQYPATPAVPVDFVEIQTRKMAAIRGYMLGETAADAARETLQGAGHDEIAFYRNAGKLEDFARLNAA